MIASSTTTCPSSEARIQGPTEQERDPELAGFNNWLGRQAAAIDERLDHINEALGAVPFNPGRYIRLEKEPTRTRTC